MVNGSARVFSNLAALDLQLSADSALYYDPMSIEWGANWKWNESHQSFLQLDYVFWSSFESPYFNLWLEAKVASPTSVFSLNSDSTTPIRELEQSWLKDLVQRRLLGPRFRICLCRKRGPRSRR